MVMQIDSTGIAFAGTLSGQNSTRNCTTDRSSHQPKGKMAT
jgi:hypothetical protein